MKNLLLSLTLIFLFLPNIVYASDLEKLAQDYYEAWVNTQQPAASAESLTNYLSFLTNDVGHQHLPYDPKGTREPDNKDKMLEGMSYYLGSHSN